MDIQDLTLGQYLITELDAAEMQVAGRPDDIAVFELIKDRAFEKLFPHRSYENIWLQLTTPCDLEIIRVCVQRYYQDSGYAMTDLGPAADGSGYSMIVATDGETLAVTYATRENILHVLIIETLPR